MLIDGQDRIVAEFQYQTDVLGRNSGIANTFLNELTNQGMDTYHLLRRMREQDRQRNLALDSINTGIRGLSVLGGQQVALHTQQLAEARGQTALQTGLLLSSERTETLLRKMTEDLVSRLDMSNQGLVTLSDQVERLFEGMLAGFGKVCIELDHGFSVISRELVVTRFVLSRNLEGFLHLTATGFTELHRKIGETNDLLTKLLHTAMIPQETGVREKCCQAIRMIDTGDFDGAIACLEKTEPLSHPFESCHFFLGYAYFKKGDLSLAEKYLARAKVFAVGKDGDKSILELATTMLSIIALRLGNLDLSEQCLRGLTDDPHYAPRLQTAHADLGALYEFSGHPEKVIPSLINHIIVNPASIEELKKSPLWKEMMKNPQFAEIWTREVQVVLKDNLIYHPETPYRVYFAFAILSLESLDAEDLAFEAARVGLRHWENRLMRCSRDLIEEEIRALSPSGEVHFSTRVLETLGEEEEFYWLHT